MTAALLTARDRDTIRASLFARLSARFSEAGEELYTQRGSDAWQQTEALAVILASLEAHAEGALEQLLPDAASGSALAAHGAVAELSRGAAETPEDFRARVLAWWQERLPACGEADLVELCEATDACDKAFVYRRLLPGTTGTFTLGCVTVVVLGPAQGSSATNTRVLGAGDLAHIDAYLEGTEDEHGVADPLGVQQRPVCSPSGNYTVEAAATTSTDVLVTLWNAPTHPFPWHHGSLFAAAATDHSVDIAGDYTDLDGLPCLVELPSGWVRGDAARVVITGAVYVAGTTTLSFAALPVAPAAGARIEACPPNWDEVQAAVFAVFDALGPGQTSPATRWPSPSSESPATLYRAALQAAIGRCQGVLKASTNPPIADVVPGAKELVTLGLLLPLEGT